MSRLSFRGPVVAAEPCGPPEPQVGRAPSASCPLFHYYGGLLTLAVTITIVDVFVTKSPPSPLLELADNISDHYHSLPPPVNRIFTITTAAY